MTAKIPIPRTMFEKIWDDHVVHAAAGEQTLLYVNLHLVHEVTSPQAFEGLRLAGRKVRRPERTVATVDHNVPTTDRSLPIVDPISKKQIDTLRQNCREFGIRLYDIHDADQGIVHVIGPELGYTQPGMTIVCGDSHTATHGALGALAFGIGTSEVEHVLATQTLLQQRPKTLEIRIDGRLPIGVAAKDLILYVIGRISTSGGVGYCIEYAGETIRGLSMEERMTVCNMSIEAGARAGLIAPDETTFDYLRGRPFAPEDFDAAVERWRTLPTDPGAKFDRTETFDASAIQPQVTWGTTPAQVTDIGGRVPDPADFADPSQRKSVAAALRVHGLEARCGHRIDPDRLRLHRLMHQRADRGLEGRRGGDSRPSRGQGRSRPGRARQRSRQAAGRGRRARRGFPRLRPRMARAGLQHVSGHESRHPLAGRALRRHEQPELRGPARQRRPHPPGFPRNGRRRRRGGTFLSMCENYTNDERMTKLE